MERTNRDTTLKKRIRSGRVRREDVTRRLAELAFGSANDCVRLALEDAPELEKLDLSLLSEIKRNEKGTVEIRLIDRLKALEQLAQSGLRVRRGYPLGRMPYLTAPAIAVCVENIAANGMTLRLDIYCPLKLGGERCEDTTMTVLGALAPMGGDLSAGPCRFDESMGLFTQSVEAAFVENEAPETE